MQDIEREFLEILKETTNELEDFERRLANADTKRKIAYAKHCRDVAEAKLRVIKRCLAILNKYSNNN